MSNVLDRPTAIKPQAGDSVFSAALTSLDVIVNDVMDAKARKRAIALLEKRARRREKDAQYLLGLRRSEQPDNVVSLRGLRGAAKAVDDAAQTAQMAQRAHNYTREAAMIRYLIGEVF